MIGDYRVEKFLLIIIVALLIAILLLYHRFKNTGIYDEITSLEAKKEELIKEIEIKKHELQNIDKQINPSSEISYKLDMLLHNRKSDNTLIVAILIAISTTIIIFFLYKFTYYIQPDNLAEEVKNLLYEVEKSLYQLR